MSRATPYQAAGLRDRFHKVILGADYSEEAAQGIIAEWFLKYLDNVEEFVAMLEEYEGGHGDS